MATRIASLRLQLIDSVSGPAKSAAGSMKSLDAALARLGKAGVPGAKRLERQLESLQRKAGSILEFREARRGLKDASTEMKVARTNVQRLEAALKSASKPTKKMEADLRSARSTLKQTTAAFIEQGRAVRSTEQTMRSYGIGGRQAISRAQKEIRSQIAQTIRSIRTLDRENRKLTPSLSVPGGRLPRAGSSGRRGSGSERHGSGVIGLAATYGGEKTIDIARTAVAEGARIEAMRNRIRAVSNSESEVAAASQIARGASGRYPLSQQSQSLSDYVELRSLAASSAPGQPIDMQKMQRNVELMAKFRTAMAASGYDVSDDDAKALAQAIEGSGRAADPNAQEKMLDAYVRAKQVFGNAISATSIRDYVMNAKASNFSTSDPAFFYTTMARLAQGNPSRLGNEFSQTMSTLIGGRMTKQGAEWLANIGMISPDQIRKGGGGKFFIQGGIREQDLLSTDQTAWAQQVLLPGLKNAGVLDEGRIHGRMDLLRKSSPGVDETTLEERAIHGLIADELSKSGFRSTVTDNLIHAIANEFLTSKDVEQMKGAMGLGAADTVSRNPVAAFDEMVNSLSNFGAVLTNPAMKDAAAIMHNIAGSIAEFSASLSEWQKNNPKAAEALGVAVPAGAAAAGGILSYVGIRKLFDQFGGGGGGGAAAAGAGKSGLLGRLGRVGGIVGTATILNELLGYVDPAGDLWGATKPVDQWFQKHLGVNPSNLSLGSGPSEKAASSQKNSAIDAGLAQLDAAIASWPDSAKRAMDDYGATLQEGGADAEAKAAAIAQAIEQDLAVTGHPDVDTSQLEHALALARQVVEAVRSIGGGSGGSTSSATSGSVGTPANSNKGFGGPRARGGPVKKGVTYLVGEKGPEPFTPGQNGYITSNRAWRAGGGASVHAPVSVHIHMHGNSSGDMQRAAQQAAATAAAAIGSELDRQLRRRAETAFASPIYGEM